jgi:hypothetical protein
MVSQPDRPKPMVKKMMLVHNVRATRVEADANNRELKGVRPSKRLK